MVLATNLAAGTVALAVALARPADPPPLAPDTEIPGGYLDSEDLRGSEPDSWLGWHITRAGDAATSPGLVVSRLHDHEGRGAIEIHEVR